MDKLRMKTLDAAEGNVAKIAALFPQCVTERKGKNGATELAIDFDKLKAELSKDVLDEGEERYQFTWPDKRAASRLANEPTDKTLRPDIDSSEDFWNTKNLYIEGDNLDVLKILRENYLGRVKMIYIDPPYNTGNDFVYKDAYSCDKDAFNDSEAKYDSDTDDMSVGLGIRRGAFDIEGNQLLDPMQRNTESNGRFHTDWLNMIYPRLKVARDLLSDEGVIFISIDDSEIENLTKVCNELCGEQNFIACIVWERSYAPINLKKHFSESHDYILCYAKDINKVICNGLPRPDSTNAKYGNPDNDPRGLWRTDNLSVGPVVADKVYEIITPSGRVCLPPKGRCWLYTKERYEEMVAENRIWFGEDGNNVPAPKRFLSEVKQGLTPMTIWKYSEVSHNQDSMRELRDLFDGEKVFDYSKPVKLVERMCQLYSSSDSIILDFFSGSATTAHAVMKLNAEDGGKRKFIMVQLPEVTDEKSEARKAGYANICEIGKERIRRAGEQIRRDAILRVRDVKGEIDFESDADRTRKIASLPDTGFRVLKLDSSNMEDVFYSPEDFTEQNLFNTIDNVKPDRTPLDLLFQVLPELNIELSAKIETQEVNGKKVFFVEGTYLIATFEKDVNESTVTEIAKLRPAYFVMRDASAANDNVLDNFEQIFKHYSPNTVCRVI